MLAFKYYKHIRSPSPSETGSYLKHYHCTKFSLLRLSSAAPPEIAKYSDLLYQFEVCEPINVMLVTQGSVFGIHTTVGGVDHTSVGHQLSDIGCDVGTVTLKVLLFLAKEPLDIISGRKYHSRGMLRLLQVVHMLDNKRAAEFEA